MDVHERDFTVRVTRSPLDASEPTTTDFVTVTASTDTEAALEAMFATKLQFRDGEHVLLEEAHGPDGRWLGEGRANLLYPLRLSERERELLTYALAYLAANVTDLTATADEYQALSSRLNKLPELSPDQGERR